MGFGECLTFGQLSHFGNTSNFTSFFFFFVYKHGKKPVTNNTLYSGSVPLSDNCPISGTACNFTSSFFFFFVYKHCKKSVTHNTSYSGSVLPSDKLSHFGNKRHQVIERNVAVTLCKFLSYLHTLAQSKSLFPTFGPSTTNKGFDRSGPKSMALVSSYKGRYLHNFNTIV